eukprot:TRINITY_DN7602_c0_g1_i1.p1 TRINITY_DN7602_c0_g1~~TRINITY_DN7602_c0_g1_i1.p1  ORF type:complete len:448 (+),score=49.37 TRINITY_DN7602_c0_g1_i1:29-1345(+)
MATPQRQQPPAGASPLWSWHDDSVNRWKNYDTATSKQLEASFQQGAGSVALNQGFFASKAGQYVVDFNKMVQTNTQTNYSRLIERSLPLQMANLNFQWQWQENDGSFKDYDPMTNQLIEYHPRPQLRLTSGLFASQPQIYSIDLNLMRQFNGMTGGSRRIRRVDPQNNASTAPPAAASAPMAAGQAMYQGAAPTFGAQATQQPANNDKASSANGTQGYQPPEGETVHAGLAAQGIPHKVVTEPLSEDENEDCCICMGPLFDDDEPEVVVELPCSHRFHGDCILPSINNGSLKCAICQQVFGKPQTGIQPPGTMSVSRSPQSCAGYEGCGSVLVSYNFPSGTQGPEHPSPGKRYSGDSRTGILPDNDKGRQVLALLKVAFQRRLVFSIGHSITLGPGAGERIVWNGIHHKTSWHGAHGYPDPTYLDRVMEELAAVGVRP